MDRYANKLVPEKGLALSVYDVLTAEDGKVTWGNGMMYYKGELALLPRTRLGSKTDALQYHSG